MRALRGFLRFNIGDGRHYFEHPPIASAIEVQREMQRKLGRCMIRIQQFELLMKAMLSSMAAEGTVEQLELALKKNGFRCEREIPRKLTERLFFHWIFGQRRHYEHKP